MRPEDPPIKVLEIGAGITLALKSPHLPNYVSDKSAPWLSRALKNAFSNLVDVTVTDKQPHDFEYLVTLTKEEELLEHFTISAPLGDDFHPYTSDFSNLLGKTRPGYYSDLFSLDNLKNIVEGSIATSPGPLFEKMEALSKSSEQDLTLRLLPMMNDNFEVANYGIKLITGVDMRNLASSKLEGSFDFVFGRHLYPLLTDHMRQVREDVRREILRVLNPNGISIISFDGSPELVLFKQVNLPRLDPADPI